MAGASGTELAQTRREQILTVALELFAAQGYAGTSIKNLAAALGVAPGLLYHYFRGKDELLEQVVEHHSLLPDLRRLLAVSGERPARVVLTQVATEFDRLLTRRQPLLRLLVHASQTQPAVARAWNKLATDGTRLLQDYLAARIAAGELRPHNTEVTARALLSPVVLAHIRGQNAGEWAGELAAILLDGLTVTSEQAEQG